MTLNHSTQQMLIANELERVDDYDALAGAVRAVLSPNVHLKFCDTNKDVENMRELQVDMANLIASRRVWMKQAKENAAKLRNQKEDDTFSINDAWRANPNKNYATSYTKRVVDGLALAAPGSRHYNQLVAAAALLADYHKTMHEIYEQRDEARRKARSMEKALRQTSQECQEADSANEELRKAHQQQAKTIRELQGDLANAAQKSEGLSDREKAWHEVWDTLADHNPQFYLTRGIAGKDNALNEIKRLQALDDTTKSLAPPGTNDAYANMQQTVKQQAQDIARLRKGISEQIQTIQALRLNLMLIGQKI